uniref:WAP domain-containing protein n=1 Tax=Salarias fasciatus TaxID=181472 RepID=A0A672FFI2_SALFA
RCSGAWVTCLKQHLFTYRFLLPVKDGVCPDRIPRACKFPTRKCKSDRDCDGKQKCCDFGCGRRCVAPKRGEI